MTNYLNLPLGVLCILLALFPDLPVLNIGRQLGLTSFSLQAAPPRGTEPELGIRDRTDEVHALLHARIIPRPGELIPDGHVVVRRGIIVGVGPQIEIPSDARRWDMHGKTIYPGLIDAYVGRDVSEPAPAQVPHWNRYVRPEISMAKVATNDPEELRQWRAEGFVARLVAPQGRIFHGSSALLTTGVGPANTTRIQSPVAQHLRLTSPRPDTRTEYPSSPMGAVALIRQTLYDTMWYRQAHQAWKSQPFVPRPETSGPLEEIDRARDANLPWMIEAPDEQYVLRADRLAREFGLPLIVLGSGREYLLLDAIRRIRRPLIVPVNFPAPPNVQTPEATADADLADLLHWKLAPENPARLVAADIPIALTTRGLKELKEFRPMLRRAQGRGLDAADALNACTLTAAKLLGAEHLLGSIEPGKGAHFMVTNGDWLGEKTEIIETWVDGIRYPQASAPDHRWDGVWKLDFAGKRPPVYLQLQVDEDGTRHDLIGLEPTSLSKTTVPAQTAAAQGSGTADAPRESRTSVTIQIASHGRLAGSFPATLWSSPSPERSKEDTSDKHHSKSVGPTIRFSATLLAQQDSEKLIGQWIDESDASLPLTGERWVSQAEGPTSVDASSTSEKGDREMASTDAVAKTDARAKLEGAPTFPVLHPLGAYGVESIAEVPAAIAFEHATVWTCGPAGVLTDVTLLVEGGKITAVGPNVELPPQCQRISARGKHLSPGIIDCHSHMATDGGVNEFTQAVTSEVRIGDFIDATDMTIYRQLAGGVTTANILHGSANPIGGQNQVIKLRWGMLPEDLKFAEAPAGIKFALGENVKQSNWGEEHRTRYPQSRMGVEQIMRDTFLAAQHYANQQRMWATGAGEGLPPRRDLELDAIVEILRRERWIHCHSYRQDEILTLLRTLESFEIQIGSLQHVLEGYKVAPEIAAHGGMASSFSDWWTYKFEVIDAIPYNGALLHQAGVVVSFNSDDAELGRHLNHEAAKAMKYGGVSPAEALKFVTLNPARQLRIDPWVGSIEVGKHADLVLWSGPPLSLTSRCEQTWIDGRKFFDLSRDHELRARDRRLHAALVRQVLDSGETMQKPGEKELMERDFWPRHDEFCGRHGHE